MAPRKRNSPTEAQGANKKKQAPLTFGNAAIKRSVTVEQTTEPQLLDAGTCQELTRASDIYCQQWGEKCEPQARTPRAGTVREDVDLDAAGMKVIEAFRHCMQQGVASGEMLDPRFLETLVLILRNDAIHTHTRVSRAAFSTLCAYLEAFPYARLVMGPEGTGEGGGKPVVVLNPLSAWTPLSE
jgi:hypothetical protein